MNERCVKILELLAKNKKMEVTRLSEILGVSQVTIRKDLVSLEKSSLITRAHGYAMLNESDDINNRLAYSFEIKQNIARRAVTDIHDGETVMIESGSCCALVALEIARNKKDITLITNSAFIADFVRKEGNIKIILLGGEYQNESQVMVGPITRKCVESFFVDKFFIGTDGFSQNSGFTGNDYMRSETVKDMAKQAKQVIVVTDASKFSKVGVVNLLPTKEISAVITDKEIPAKIKAYLEKESVKVVVIE